MNWLDILILLSLASGAYFGYKRGLIKEMSSLAGLIVGFLFAINNADFLAERLEKIMKFSWSLLYVISFIIIFGFGVGAVLFAERFLMRIVKAPGIKGLNEILGAAFGFCKYSLIMAIFLLLLTFFAPASVDNSIDNSNLAGHVFKVLPFIYKNTAFFHEGSGDFLGDISNTLKRSKFGQNVGEKALAVVSDDDIKAIEKFKKYFDEKKKDK